MTERQIWTRYCEAYADWDNSPSHYNARDVLKWALKLGEISDDYQAQVDEAHDIFDASIG